MICPLVDGRYRMHNAFTIYDYYSSRSTSILDLVTTEVRPDRPSLKNGILLDYVINVSVVYGPCNSTTSSWCHFRFCFDNLCVIIRTKSLPFCITKLQRKTWLLQILIELSLLYTFNIAYLNLLLCLLKKINSLLKTSPNVINCLLSLGVCESAKKTCF